MSTKKKRNLKIKLSNLNNDLGDNGSIKSKLNELDNRINNIKSDANIKMKLLWSNSAESTSISTKNVTLSESINNYTLYLVVFKAETSYNNYDTTGPMPVASQMLLQAHSNKNKYRTCSVSGTKFKIGNGYKCGSYNDTSTDNNVCIPVKVYGIKILS